MSDRDERAPDPNQSVDTVPRSEVEALRTDLDRLAALLELIQSIAVAANQAQTFGEALGTALRLVCEYHDWTIGHVYLLAADGSGDFISTGVWHCVSNSRFEDLRRKRIEARFCRGNTPVGRVIETGEALWIDDIAAKSEWWDDVVAAAGLRSAILFPIRAGARVVGVMEFYSDRPVEVDERFRRAMRNVGIQLGHVIERKRLERKISELSDAEQRRIGEELHDSLGQQVTAVAMLAKSLQQKLAAKGEEEAEQAAILVENLERAKDQIGALIRGLIPVEVRAPHLPDALEALAARAAAVFDIECRIEHCDDISIGEDAMALQLYRIAQEAIHNAVKHGDADLVTVSLEGDPAGPSATLRIEDNGTGFQSAEEDRESTGMGLRIMKHRASLIGGTLDIHTASSGGVAVVCTFPLAG